MYTYVRYPVNRMCRDPKLNGVIGTQKGRDMGMHGFPDSETQLGKMRKLRMGMGNVASRTTKARSPQNAQNGILH